MIAAESKTLENAQGRGWGRGQDGGDGVDGAVDGLRSRQRRGAARRGAAVTLQQIGRQVSPLSFAVRSLFPLQ